MTEETRGNTMHFRQLEAFVNVIRLKSFSRAAEEIFLSQPTISAHISALESELGVKLIIRSSKEVSPSWAGKILYRYAVDILNTRDKAEMALKSCAGDVSGTLEIAASTVPAQYLLPKLLAAMAGDYPNLFYTVKQCDSKDAIARIMNMEAEVGMVGTLPEHPKCRFEAFYEDRLVVITPNTPKFRNLGEIFPADMLLGQPFILRKAGSGTRKETEEALSAIGIDSKALRVMAEMDSAEAVKQTVAAGLGISVTSHLAAEGLVRAGTLRCFDLAARPATRKLYVIYNVHRPLSPAAGEFIRHVRGL